MQSKLNSQELIKRSKNRLSSIKYCFNFFHQSNCFYALPMIESTDYGRPMKPFFHWNPELLGLGRQIGKINSGAFGVFRPNHQHPFWYSESLVHVFHTLFLKKTLNLYIYIPNICLGLGFEFGPQRIRDLASVCP